MNSIKQILQDWTFIEWMIGISIVGIILVIALTSIGIVKHKDTQCIGGYLFTNPIQYDFKHPVNPVQIMDSTGRGIRCGPSER